MEPDKTGTRRASVVADLENPVAVFSKSHERGNCRAGRVGDVSPQDEEFWAAAESDEQSTQKQRELIPATHSNLLLHPHSRGGQLTDGYNIPGFVRALGQAANHTYAVADSPGSNGTAPL